MEENTSIYICQGLEAPNRIHYGAVITSNIPIRVALESFLSLGSRLLVNYIRI